MANTGQHNIVFFQNSIAPSAGGVARVSDIVSKELSIRGYNCFFVYYDKGNGGYDDSVKLKVYPDSPYAQFESSVLQFILKNNINYFICQNTYSKPFIKVFSSIRSLYPIYPFITFLHAAPDYWKTYKIKGGRIKYNYFHTLAKNVIKRITYPFYNPYVRSTTALYNLSDKFILLSDSFKSSFTTLYAKPTLGNKLYTIPHPLSGNVDVITDKLSQKEKIVLIVSRLEEGQKNLSIALEIWKHISQLTDHVGWKLFIVGTGPDQDYYKRYVDKNKMINVIFLGQRADVADYYKKASIFLMTSMWEDLPISLMEAQQNGVVPVVFDNFLAVYDVIIDGENGYVIPDNDAKLYTEKLSRLITCDDLRYIMARRAIERSARYHIHNIVDTWEEMLLGAITPTFLPQD